jgi:hypothetical protein
MSDDPILAALERMEAKLAAATRKQRDTLDYGLRQMTLQLRAEMADGQAGILGTINGWMERLRDDQKAALGHATMAFTAAQGNSQNVETLLQLFYELQKRVLDIEERLRDDRHQDPS